MATARKNNHHRFPAHRARPGGAATLGRLAGIVLCAAASALAFAQDPAEWRARLAHMIPFHPGYLGALAPENLDKERPPAPADFTGTWFVDLSGGFGNFRFGPPYSEFMGQTKEDFKTGQRMRAVGTPWRDAIGQCR